MNISNITYKFGIPNKNQEGAEISGTMSVVYWIQRETKFAAIHEDKSDITKFNESSKEEHRENLNDTMSQMSALIDSMSEDEFLKFKLENSN